MQFSKNGQEAKAQKREAVLLLRFRAAAPTPASKKYMSYRAIAEITNCSAYCVQHICRYALKPASAKRKAAPARQLAQRHVDFLRSDRTLELWSGKRLRERSALFHQRYPAKKIAVTTLRRLYLKHKVRRKKVRQEKLLPEGQRESFVRKCADV